jgi:glycerophosphoryl diester phosphodiesterase
MDGTSRGWQLSARAVVLIVVSAGVIAAACAMDGPGRAAPGQESGAAYDRGPGHGVQLGPRPFFLVDDMAPSALKDELTKCAKGPFKRTDFSIGHRGAPLQFPEHTKESYEAAAKMGAGILECDVTFTKDRELVCRHSQCDLHTTTNILETPLAARCSLPFMPADPATGRPAQAQCCTSDITLAEFRTLKGKMDAANPRATTVHEYLGGSANWRTDLYSARGTLLTHAESIALFEKLGTKMTPELKSPSVPMPFEGDYTQEDYAQQMIDEYKAAGVSPSMVWAQSFNYEDVLYWVRNEPAFGEQAVFLDARVDQPGGVEVAIRTMQQVAADGVNIIAPPMWALVTLDADERLVPSAYAMAARNAGLEIITWTLERSGPLKDGGGYYYQSISEAIERDGDTFVMLDVLAREVGVVGVFSDWPATTTFYANCIGLD